MQGRKKEENRVTIEECYDEFKKTEEFKTATARQVTGRFLTFIEMNYKLIKIVSTKTDTI